MKIKKITYLSFWLLVFFISFFGILYLVLTFGYRGRFYPRTKIAGYDISHFKKEKAEVTLHQKLQGFNQEIIFANSNFLKKAKPEKIGIEINLDKTVNFVFQEGRESFFKELSFLIFGKDFNLNYEIDFDRLNDFFEKEIKQIEIPYRNNTLSWKNGKFENVSGVTGRAVNKKLFYALLINNIENLSAEKIKIPVYAVFPRIKKSELEQAKSEAKRMTLNAFSLVFENKKWSLSPYQISDLIVFKESDDQSRELQKSDYLNKDNFILDNFILDNLGLENWHRDDFNKILTAELDRKKTGNYLENLALKINQEPIDARFLMKDKKLEVLAPSRAGRELLIEGNYKKMSQQVKTENRFMVLEIRVRGAEITQEKINQYGIKELIGNGESNFSGSPFARQHNIEVAVKKLTGIIIKPGEVFSLVESLGEVNAESGYLPELVIKERKTIPEFGGGLCQIATTLFRAAMRSGLPILERQSHAYAVSYYDPQGTDATIYIPHPDLQFKNDTSAYFLIQPKIEEDNLIFEFFGKKDGREIKFEGPEYWDRKNDGSFRARWTQIVKKKNKETRQTFYSFYQPPEKFH